MSTFKDNSAKVLNQLFALWVIFVLAELILLKMIPGTHLQNHLLTGIDSINLLCTEFIVLALIFLILSPFLFVVNAQLLKARIGKNERKIKIAILFVLFFAANFVYISSWSVFRSTGQFLNIEGFRFMAGNIVQMFQHVAQIEPWALAFVPLITLGLTVFLVRIVLFIPKKYPKFHAGITMIFACLYF